MVYYIQIHEIYIKMYAITRQSVEYPLYIIFWYAMRQGIKTVITIASYASLLTKWAEAVPLYVVNHKVPITINNT